jgi:hypothetical protein
MDEHEQPTPTTPRLLHRPGESERVASLRWDDRGSSLASVGRALIDTIAYPSKGRALRLALGPKNTVLGADRVHYLNARWAT